LLSFVLARAHRRNQLYINEVVLGTLFGVLIGPYVLDALNPRAWIIYPNTITLEVMRIVLGVRLFAIGVDLPTSYMWKHRRGLFVMVLPTMIIGWFLVAGAPDSSVDGNNTHSSARFHKNSVSSPWRGVVPGNSSLSDAYRP
jgi:NhaP-type Na+/H+ or K+/H+ antiporter